MEEREISRQLASIVERASLVKRGLYKCDGGGTNGKGCGRIRPLDEGIVVLYRGNLVRGLCRDCFGPDEIVISRTERGIVTSVRGRAVGLVLASSLGAIRSVTDAVLKPFLKKKEGAR